MLTYNDNTLIRKSIENINYSVSRLKHNQHVTHKYSFVNFQSEFIQFLLHSFILLSCVLTLHGLPLPTKTEDSISGTIKHRNRGGGETVRVCACV